MHNSLQEAKKEQHILVIRNLFTQDKIITLNDSSFSIGRNSSNSLVVKSHLISRFHITIFPLKRSLSDSCSYWIMDGNIEAGMRSTNGVMVNKSKVLMHELQSGDVINLPNDIEIIYRKIEKKYTETQKEENQYLLLENIGNDKILEKPTIPKLEKSLANLDNPSLIRLVTFTELNPFPIIEINTELEITYINSIAEETFSNIYDNPVHPIIINMMKIWYDNEIVEDIVEFTDQDKIFEQYIYKLEEYKVIRSYIVDITSKKQIQNMLEYNALHDELTGVFNRRLLIKQLSEFISEYQDNVNQSFAILFLDIDRFKNINDTFGHNFGDLVLQSFTVRLQQCITSDEIIARWGGDEFVIIVKYRQVEEVSEVAQKILENLKKPIQINKNSFYIKVSIGISIYPQDGINPENLIKNADSALYRSKEQGKFQYKYYTTTMTSKASTYLNLENLLHQALENQELLLYYQPQINVETKTVSGMEALIRWQHPELGIINPQEFIPLAEETGLIISIGEWVLRTACLQNKVWQESGFNDLKISVNISYQQLYQPDFTNIVTLILAETGLEAKYLELEITETSLVKDIDLFDNILKRLQAMGIGIGLDDFGVGYSSLNYLKRIDFNTLKLDKSFLENILEKNSRDLAIISGVAVLAEKLNIKIIAEGVETEQQLDILMDIFKNIQTLYIQGYFYSRPLPVAEATNFLMLPEWSTDS